VTVREGGQSPGLKQDGDVGCPGQTDDPEVLMKLPVNWNTGDGDDRSGEHRHKGFTGGVEGSGVDGLCSPESERDSEDPEVGRSGGGVGCVKGAATEDDVDGRPGEGDHDRGAENRESDEAGDRAVDRSSEGGELLAAEE